MRGRTYTAWVLAAALTALPGLAWAQLPGVGGAAPAAAGAAPAPAAAAGAGGGLFGLLCPSPEQLEMCKKKFCSCPLGKLISNAIKPISALSGGLIPECCPTEPSASDVEKLKEKGGAEGLAAQIQAEEANAKARRAAVRYLGTVDCDYYPEVADALIASLRADKNECVRWEAAMAMGSGCCCKEKTMKALLLTINASDEDGNPAEKVLRVRAAALASLQKCMCCYKEKVKRKKPEDVREPGGVPPVEGPPRERTPDDPGVQTAAQYTTNGIRLTAYYQKLGKNANLDKVAAEAEKLLKKYGMEVEETPAPAPPLLPRGDRSLFGLFTRAAQAEGGTVISETPLVPNVPMPSRPLPHGAPGPMPTAPVMPAAGTPAAIEEVVVPATSAPPAAPAPMPREPAAPKTSQRFAAPPAAHVVIQSAPPPGPARPAPPPPVAAAKPAPVAPAAAPVMPAAAPVRDVPFTPAKVAAAPLREVPITAVVPAKVALNPTAEPAGKGVAAVPAQDKPAPAAAAPMVVAAEQPKAPVLAKEKAAPVIGGTPAMVTIAETVTPRPAPAVPPKVAAVPAHQAAVVVPAPTAVVTGVAAAAPAPKAAPVVAKAPATESGVPAMITIADVPATKATPAPATPPRLAANPAHQAAPVMAAKAPADPGVATMAARPSPASAPKTVPAEAKTAGTSGVPALITMEDATPARPAPTPAAPPRLAATPAHQSAPVAAVARTVAEVPAAPKPAPVVEKKAPVASGVPAMITMEDAAPARPVPAPTARTVAEVPAVPKPAPAVEKKVPASAGVPAMVSVPTTPTRVPTVPVVKEVPSVVAAEAPAATKPAPVAGTPAVVTIAEPAAPRAPVRTAGYEKPTTAHGRTMPPSGVTTAAVPPTTQAPSGPTTVQVTFEPESAPAAPSRKPAVETGAPAAISFTEPAAPRPQGHGTPAKVIVTEVKEAARPATPGAPAMISFGESETPAARPATRGAPAQVIFDGPVNSPR